MFAFPALVRAWSKNEKDPYVIRFGHPLRAQPALVALGLLGLLTAVSLPTALAQGRPMAEAADEDDEDDADDEDRDYADVERS